MTADAIIKPVKKLFESMKSKLVLYLTLFILIPLLGFGSFVYGFMRDNSIKETRYNMQTRLNNCREMINRDIILYIEKTNYILSNNFLIDNIQKDYSGSLTDMMYMYQSLSVLFRGFQSSEYQWTEDFNIFSDNRSLYPGEFLDRLENLEDNATVRAVLNSKNTDIVWNSNIMTNDRDEKYISFYRNMQMPSNTVGILRVNIPFAKIEFYMDSVSLTQGEMLFYVNKNSGVVYQINAERSNEQADPVNDRKFLAVEGALINGDKIVSAIPRKMVNQKYDSVFVIGCLSAVILAMVIWFVSYITLKKITGSLYDFTRMLKNNEEMLLNEEMIVVTGNDEVSVIKNRFKKILARMNMLHKETMAFQLQNKALEIELLQTRVNPHLLYNSLSVIRWSAMGKNDMTTVEIVETMSRYYRMALNKGNNVLKIRNEIDMIAEYVKINEYAHSSRYELVVDVPEEIMNYYTLKHILQPIVENSILHGLNGKEGERVITVKGRMEGGDIVLEVSDNGYGMGESTIEDILGMRYRGNYGGYGVKNMIKRIKACYGSGYGLDIRSKIGKGTTVQVRIAALSEEELTGRVGAGGV